MASNGPFGVNNQNSQAQPSRAQGVHGPQGPTSTYQGPIGVTGPGGPVTNPERILLSRPVPDHQVWSLQLVYTTRTQWQASGHNMTISSHTIRAVGPKSKTMSWQSPPTVAIGEMKNGKIEFPDGPQGPDGSNTDRTPELGPAQRLCYEVMKGDVLIKPDADGGLLEGTVTHPFRNDVLYDRFWQQFLDDASSMSVVADVLLT